MASRTLRREGKNWRENLLRVHVGTLKPEVFLWTTNRRDDQGVREWATKGEKGRIPKEEGDFGKAALKKREPKMQGLLSVKTIDIFGEKKLEGGGVTKSPRKGYG